MSQATYEYMVHTWGGFYNPEYHAQHGLEEGYFWFPTAEAAAAFIRARQVIEAELDARHLMTETQEGCNTRTRTVCSMDLLLDGKAYAVRYDFGMAFPEDGAEFIFMEGNKSCDCNLRALICMKYPEVPADRKCGDSIEVLNFHVHHVPVTGDHAPLDIDPYSLQLEDVP